MDPDIFESSYHAIRLDDARLGLFDVIDITNYVSGWGAARSSENYAVLDTIARWMGLKNPKQVPATFTITNKPDLLDPGETFSTGGLRRAYDGRAAPEEIRNAIRLAYATGRFKHPVAAAGYAKQWFGIDCNAFVGNYCGISPNTSIAAYVNGYVGAKPSGATADVIMSMGLLPIPPVKSMSEIKIGTVIVTHGHADSHGNTFRHIALVLGFKPDVGIPMSGKLSFAEWGDKGGSSKHVLYERPVKLKTFACPDAKGQTLIYFDGQCPDHTPGKRFFLDGSKFDPFEVRGLHVYNTSGAQTFNT